MSRRPNPRKVLNPLMEPKVRVMRRMALSTAPSSPLSTALATALIVALLTALLMPVASAAATYPARAVRVIVPYPVGGPIDAIGRRLAEGLQRETGQPFVVENRAGASGSIGADAVAKAAPDGHTLLFTIPDAVINVASTVRHLPYDPRKDFAFITQVASSGAVLIVNPGLKARSLADLEQAGRVDPMLAFGSWGPGSYPHVLGQAMVRKSGVAFVHVPYRGAAPALQDLLANQIGFAFGPANLAVQFQQKGQASLLAVSGPRRSPLLPDVPTFAEQGYDGPAFLLTAWAGLLAPVGTDPSIVEVLHRTAVTVARTQAFHTFLASLGFEPMASTPSEFRAAFDREFPLINDILRSTGLQPE